MMTSRERVLTTFEHQEPDRVPCWCGSSPEFWRNAKQTLGLDDESLRRRLGDDFRSITAPYVSPGNSEPLLSPGATSRTYFGVEHGGLGYGQPLSHPLADATLDQIHQYPWPNSRWVDVSHIQENAMSWNRQYAILGGSWSPFWHDVIDLMGMENLFLKMYDDPEAVDAVFQHVTDFYIESSRRIFDVAADDIDVFFIGNDFGSQTGPLLSVELFERFVLPHLKRLIDLGHHYDLYVQLHCCGGIEPLFPSMITAGLDALHAIQNSCHGMDLKTLKTRYGKKVVLNGGIDSHHVLIDGESPAYVREATRQALDILMPGGGFIAGASHDSILEETPLKNVLAMFDAIQEFGQYKAKQ